MKQKIKKWICKFFGCNVYIEKSNTGKLYIQCSRCGEITN